MGGICKRYSERGTTEIKDLRKDVFSMSWFFDPIIMWLMDKLVQSGASNPLKVLGCIVLACLGTLLGMGLMVFFSNKD